MYVFNILDMIGEEWCKQPSSMNLFIERFIFLNRHSIINRQLRVCKWILLENVFGKRAYYYLKKYYFVWMYVHVYHKILILIES